jgi:transposase
MIRTGRPRKVYDDKFLRLIYDDYTHMTGQQVADKYGLSLSTVRRYVRLIRQREEDATNDKETR